MLNQLYLLSLCLQTRHPPPSFYRIPESNDDNVGVGPTFVPLVDVGTATMRLSHAHTQTEVKVPPDCTMPVPAAQQTDFSGVFYHDQQQSMQDSYTATSPPHLRLANGTPTAQMSVASSPPPTACKYQRICFIRCLVDSSSRSIQ